VFKVIKWRENPLTRKRHQRPDKSNPLLDLLSFFHATDKQHTLLPTNRIKPNQTKPNQTAPTMSNHPGYNPGQFQQPGQGFAPPQQQPGQGFAQPGQGFAQPHQPPGQGFAPPPPGQGFAPPAHMAPGQGFAPPPPGGGGGFAPPPPGGGNQQPMQHLNSAMGGMNFNNQP